MARSVEDVQEGDEVIEPVKPGHLKDHDLHLPQSPKVRKALSAGTKRHYAMLKLKAAKLDWRKP